MLNELYEDLWKQFDQTTKVAWLSMLLTTQRGATRHSLYTWSGLEIEAFNHAFEKLVQLDLIEEIMGNAEKNFRIHSSARGFLNHTIFDSHSRLS